MNALRPYAQLVRLPNLPSAFADILLGALAVGALPGRWPTFLLLALASACLYCGGMAFNDFFDREQDRRERPFRPIPSGRVTPAQAARLGAALLAAGVALALLAGWVQVWRGEAAGPARPPLVAALLAGAILLYDGVLKKTWAGPAAMGLCRFLNVLLGVSVSGALGGPTPLTGPHLAAVVGLYVAGVTWVARREAGVSRPAQLLGGGAVMQLSLVLALFLPLPLPRGTSSPLFPYLLVAFGFAVLLPVAHAAAAPTPARVQAAVKGALLGLIVLDAVLASAVAGTVGLVVLVLLAPALYLNARRWLYAT